MPLQMEYRLRADRSSVIDAALAWHHRKIRSYLDPLLAKYDRPPSTILEVGPGLKSRKPLIARARLVSTDFVERKTTDVKADVGHLPIREGLCDLVLCENVLEHVSEPMPAAKELWRVLRLGGDLFVVTPFMFPIHDPPNDFFRYTAYALVRMFSDFGNVSVHSVPLFPLFSSPQSRFPLFYVCIATK